MAALTSSRAGCAVFMALLGGWAYCMYVLLAYAAHRGNPALSMLAVWGASPLLLVFLGTTMEHRSLLELMNLRTGSWAFLLGDTILLPAAAAVCAWGWEHLDRTVPRWYTSAGWYLLSAALGLLAAAVFHYNDTNAYRKAGAELALNSPTKLAHDLVAYSVLFGGLVCIGVPLLFDAATRPYAAVAVIGVVLWLIAGIRDGVHGLNPHDLHPLGHWLPGWWPRWVSVRQ